MSLDKDELLALVAHDIKSPMSCIIGYVSLLLERTEDERDRHALRRIASAASWALGLVGDLTDAAAAEHGGLRLDAAPCDLGALARDVVSDLSVRGQAARVSMEARVPPAPVVVLADPARVAQVLYNLLSNALKHTAAGGRVRVDVLAAGPEATVCVADDGCGIAPEHQERIFEKFFQVRPGYKGGVGLGLYVAREIVDRHGGRLGVRSDGPGTGALFHFTLPLFDPGRAYEEYRSERGAPTPRPLRRQPRPA